LTPLKETTRFLPAGFRLVRVPASTIQVPAPLPATVAEPFFDGKSLTRWKAAIKHWRTENGQIIGAFPEGIERVPTHLFQPQSYRDFELSVKARLTDGLGNSGIVFRGRVANTRMATLKGPECDLGGPNWGRLYGDNNLMTPPPPDARLKPADFN